MPEAGAPNAAPGSNAGSMSGQPALGADMPLPGFDRRTNELAGAGMFNGEQLSYMKFLSTLPPEAKCPSGWCPKDQCHDPNHWLVCGPEGWTRVVS